LFTNRTKSHDPNASKYGRSSIQLTDPEKIQYNCSKRTNSVRKIRNHSNKTLLKLNDAQKENLWKILNFEDKDALNNRQWIEKVDNQHAFITTANFGKQKQRLHILPKILSY